MNNLKFLGLFDTDYYNGLCYEEKKQLLIENEIFVPKLPTFKFIRKELNYPLQEIYNPTDTENDLFTENWMIFRGMAYDINFKVLEDIFIVLEDSVLAEFDEKIYLKIAHYQTLLEEYLEEDIKKEFIKKEYYKLLNLISENKFLVYYKNIDLEYDWKNIVCCELYNFSEIVKKHILCEDNFYDLSNYEIHESWVNLELQTNLMSFLKGKLTSGNEEITLSLKSNNIDLSYQICLLENILKLNDWEALSATKKGKILTKLLGKNADNIKDKYLELEKKSSEISSKMLKDRKDAIEFLNKILG
jgi:hypothetical protein